MKSTTGGANWRKPRPFLRRIFLCHVVGVGLKNLRVADVREEIHDGGLRVFVQCVPLRGEFEFSHDFGGFVALFPRVPSASGKIEIHSVRRRASSEAHFVLHFSELDLVLFAQHFADDFPLGGGKRLDFPSSGGNKCQVGDGLLHSKFLCRRMRHRGAR